MSVKIPEVIKHHAPVIVGSVAGLALIWYMVRGKTTAPVSTPVPQFIVQPAAPSNASTPVQSSADVMAYINSVTGLVAATGNAAAAAYQTEAELPAAAINAAAGQNQVALSSAAGVAAAGISATPDYLNAASNLAAASYLPFNSFAKSVGAMVGNVGQSASGILNAIGQSSASSTSAAASSASAAAGANAASTQSEMQGAESAAMIALMFL